MDIYVPSNLKSFTKPLPVIVWFYGGGYIAGAKSNSKTKGLLYSGVGPIRSAASEHGNGVIFVTGNYRLGAFGWIAGEYVENNATPNAGLTDQRLVLEFVQKYISQLGGDKDNVSAWGESAGGGSIMHHLVARNEDGTARDPLFKKAVIQSPAHEWRWDRKGKLNQQYRNFSTIAGCLNGDIACLRKLPAVDLSKANNEMTCDSHKYGLFPFGPAVDGKVIKELPVYAFGKGSLPYSNFSTLPTYC